MSFSLNIGFYNPSRKWCRLFFPPVFDFSLGETGAPAELDVEGGRTDIFGRGWSGEAISDRRQVTSYKALSNVNFWSITKL